MSLFSRALAACGLAFGLMAASMAAAQAIPVQSTDASGTITAGGTFQTVFAAGPRRGCLIQNPIAATETLFVHDTAAAPTTANSWGVAPGGFYSCGANEIVVNGQIQVEAATTAHAFVATQQ